VFLKKTGWTALLIFGGAAGGLWYNWPMAVDSPALGQPPPPRRQAHNLATSEQHLEQPVPNRSSSTGSFITALTTNGQPASNPSSVEAFDMEGLRAGDRLLLGGNFLGAHQQYNKLASKADVAGDASLELRLGLAAERAGFLSQGEAHFRSVIQASSSSAAQKLWALVATARVWEAQSRLDEASRLLCELFLLYSHDRFPAEFRSTIITQLANCLQKQFLNSQYGSLQPQPLVPHYFWSEPQLEPILADSIAVPESPSGNPQSNVIELVQNPMNQIPLMVVDSNASFRPILQWIDDLAVTILAPIEISPKARAVLAGRSIRMDVNSIPVPVLLDQLFAPYAVVWRFHEQGIAVEHRRELTPEERRSFDLDHAQRLLRYLQMNVSSVPDRQVALMHDGNNCYLDSDWQTAANKYQAAAELQPSGELSALLYFNTALLHLAGGESQRALDQFYRSLDQTLSHPLQAAAYGMIAELELEAGRPSQAITTAARGLRLASDPGIVTQNAMALAKAYLLEDEPYAANQVLFDSAAQISDGRVRRVASVLGAHARFQAIKPFSGLQREGERLVLTLAAMQPGDPQDFIEHILIARAFESVGFRTKAAEHLELASSGSSPAIYWTTRIRLELAQILSSRGEVERASEVLDAVELLPEDPLAADVGLLNAGIKFELDRLGECEELCQKLLAIDGSTEHKQKVLTLLGKTYSQSGRHHAAALCFAGLLPLAEDDAIKADNP
jgi:tetratricopeptide (TPR) repeat protein